MVRLNGSGSHLFQRVASFLLKLPAAHPSPFTLFSSLSESGFIPTPEGTGSFKEMFSKFSSLSESGFIPTRRNLINAPPTWGAVLISFREWLHSYSRRSNKWGPGGEPGSHLFQRVASFLPTWSSSFYRWRPSKFSSLSESGFIPTFAEASPRRLRPFGVLISFREWLHSYWTVCPAAVEKGKKKFSSLSESGFIPTMADGPSNLSIPVVVLISFREWLHSYCIFNPDVTCYRLSRFSSLSESGFIPT